PTVDSPTSIRAVVPLPAVGGRLVVTVSGGGVAQSPRPFTVVPPPPAITSFSPGTGLAGAPVTLAGSSFVGVRSVTLGGVRASFRVVSNGSILATVPAAALTGPIAVVTRSGSAQSATDFTVLPRIDRLRKDRGPPG